MKTLRINLVLAMTALLWSCGSIKSTDANTGNSCDALSTKSPNVENPNSFHIDEMIVEDDCLLLKGYVSGCSEGESELVWNGISTRSLPPQIQLELIVYEAGFCDMINEKEWRYDLKDLKMDDVIIRLNDSDLEVHYMQK